MQNTQKIPVVSKKVLIPFILVTSLFYHCFVLFTSHGLRVFKRHEATDDILHNA
jgi:hypothetical protein